MATGQVIFFICWCVLAILGGALIFYVFDCYEQRAAARHAGKQSN